MFLKRLISLRRPRAQVGDASFLVTDLLEDVADLGGEVVERRDKVGEKDGGVFCGHSKRALRVLQPYLRNTRGVVRCRSCESPVEESTTTTARDELVLGGVGAMSGAESS
jgi:hypothetical protein